jgi:DNA-binding transcriptional MerR regulator
MVAKTLNSRVKRPVDLARAAGVSTQQVRNLEALGVLPQAERTESGYRSYGAVHLSALLAYQALVPGFGAPVSRRILVAVAEGRVAEALELIDAGHAGLHEARRSLGEITGTLVGVSEPVAPGVPDVSIGRVILGVPEERPDGLRVGELAGLVGVRTSALRVWEAAGLLTPGRERGTGYRVYGPEDVRDARVIQALRQEYYLFDRIRPVIEGIRREGSVDALHAALAERREALDRRALAMLDGAARLRDYLDVSAGAGEAGAAEVTSCRPARSG